MPSNTPFILAKGNITTLSFHGICGDSTWHTCAQNVSVCAAPNTICCPPTDSTSNTWYSCPTLYSCGYVSGYACVQNYQVGGYTVSPWVVALIVIALIGCVVGICCLVACTRCKKARMAVRQPIMEAKTEEVPNHKFVRMSDRKGERKHTRFDV
ncbi:hypothetical protein HK101_008290 [Irineochytrium annulatum]|nr:hypothetical protein HK101_008290 [Irineochytrium annulatum]